MKVILGIPYRGVETYRQEIFQVVKPILTNLYPWDGVLVEDSGHEFFNRAATRNLIVKNAQNMGADVVVICDADSIPQDLNLSAAVVSAYNHNGMYIPFERVSVIPHLGVYRYGTDYKTANELLSYGPSCGGCFVVRPSDWVFAGGMDERIKGWGYEDQIFIVALKTFLGGYTTLPGTLYNFAHPRGDDYFSSDDNAALRDSYHRVMGDYAAVRRLSVGSNSFCTYEGSAEQTAGLWGRV